MNVSFRVALGFWLMLALSPIANAADTKRIVMVAGTPSHGIGEHEFNAGLTMLKKCLDPVAGLQVILYTNGWPKDPAAFDGAAEVVLYMDGGQNHPAIKPAHLGQLKKAMDAGAGLACFHYAVEVPKTVGGPEFLGWIGGYFEENWSVNPMWKAEFTSLPDHPITRGVKPLTVFDEWYFHMRFQSNNVTPILTAVPPDSVRDHPDDPHGGNPVVRAGKGQPEVVAWAYDRPDGGRGFGFTGAHYQKNWGNEDFRKLVLNAIVWVAKAEVPTNGVSSTVTAGELAQNLDPKPSRKKH